MAQQLEKTENPFSFIDLEKWNPWWKSEDGIPPSSYHRSDLYWRVKNTLEQDILLIPGAPVTGTEQTLKQLARALLLGEEHESSRIAGLFDASDDTDIDEGGYDPLQVCYAKCNDPIAHLVDDYVNEVRRSYHRRAAGTSQLDYFILLEDIHRLDSWREQLLDTHSTIQRELPENWTIVATLPMSRLAYDFTETEDPDIGKVDTDLPHHTQKFRNTLFSTSPGSDLQKNIKPAREDDTLLAGVRDEIKNCATGNTDADRLVDAVKKLHGAIREKYDTKDLSRIVRQYLIFGGFEPALAQTEVEADKFDLSSNGPQAAKIEAVSARINSGLERTLYQDVPRLAKIEENVKQVKNPEEVHGMIAFLARREFTETTYIDLGEFLSCDTRTIRNKYVDILEGFHIGERATRYDLERDRSLRFYLRSPGYVTALTNQQKISKGKTDQEEWDKRLRLTLADHLRRLLPKYESDNVLQYWRDDDHLVDYVFDIGGTPVPFISEFADDTKGGTIGGLDAFNERLNKLKDDSSVDTEYQQPNLEVIITGFGEGVSAQQTNDDRLRLRLPHWLLLSIC